MKLLVIAGHGAGDSGAVGNGYQEQERVRSLAARVKALGGASVDVYDTSKNCYSETKAGRGLYQIDPKKYDAVVELHLDSAVASAKGGSVLIKAGFKADKYDNALDAYIKANYPGRSSVIVGRSNLLNANVCAKRGINYRLLECCFISNAADIKKFNGDLDGYAKGILASFGIATAATPKQVPGTAKNDKGLKYKLHVQNLGDLAEVHDGQAGGTVGYGLRSEGIYFTALPKGVTLKIRTHSQNKGWSPWQDVKLNTLYGTKGDALRLEAVEIKAYKDGKEIDIYYRAHVQNIGWQAPVKNGATGGTTGKALRLEALEVWLP